MKMNEKILQCRKRLGMSQEELARQLNTSRQAISQWELGNAQPEVQNVIALAKIFGVTTDWLLLDTDETSDATQVEYHARPEDTKQQCATRPDDWIDRLPQMVARMVRRYGWLYGVYLAVGGLLFTIIGSIANSVATSMGSSFSSFTTFGGLGYGGWDSEIMIFDEVGAVVTDPAVYNALGYSGPASAAAASFSNPVAAVSGLIIAIGVLAMVIGITLALILKRRAEQ